jgi:hypothetical protein
MSQSVFAHQISADFLKREIEIANIQYLTGTPESGLYALKSVARLLESELNVTQMEVGINHLAFTYLRIGLLLEKLGKVGDAESYFQKAKNAYQGGQLAITQLKQVVKHMDSKRS